MKIQDTLKQILKEELSEEIRASEAYSDYNSIKTIIDGKRDVAFIESSAYIYLISKFYGLKIIKVPNSRNYIVYRKESEDKAKELLNIANKYGGYLSYTATEDESRRIGQLLGYNESDIQDYIEHNKKNQKLI
jgi:replicative superfamily II helicase